MHLMLPGKATRVVLENKSWEVGVGFDFLPAKIEKKLFEFIRQQEFMAVNNDEKT
jgi:hypothetical protein